MNHKNSTEADQPKGPLAGVKVIEFAGIGSAPMSCMLLADLGADVVKIDRVASSGLGIEVPPQYDVLSRNRRSIALNLKSAEGVDAALRLVSDADIVIEGFRPGVAERLGIGPDACLKVKPDLVYGRLSGWGQDGPLSERAGHDLNYIAITGALHAMGRAGEAPPIPLMFVGDFAGGALYMAFGVVAALQAARRTGKGEVVDAAMSDGVAHLTSIFSGMLASGDWTCERGTNVLDGSAPYYAVYRTKDEKYYTLGALESKFFVQALEALEVDFPVESQFDKARWPELRELLERAFGRWTQDELRARLDHIDSCCAPVLSFEEAHTHPHAVARGVYTEVAGLRQPMPAPRFRVNETAAPRPPAKPGTHTQQLLSEAGYNEAEIEKLCREGIALQAEE